MRRLNPKETQALNLKANINYKTMNQINNNQYLTVLGIDWCSEISRTVEEEEKRVIE